jgi:hypothetical protein
MKANPEVQNLLIDTQFLGVIFTAGLTFALP